MNDNFLTTSLRSRAEFYAEVIIRLYNSEGLPARIVDLKRGPRFLTLGVRLADSTQLDKAIKLSEPIALGSHSKAVLSQREFGVVRYQFQLPGKWWEVYTRADVEGLCIGLGERGKRGQVSEQKRIEFSFSPPHALIAGTTDSGKTECVKSALCALLTTYTPDDLGLLIIDPHADYSAFDNAAHLVAPIARTPEDTDALLTYAGDELAQRKGNNVKDARRLILVIDEAESALAADVRLEIAQRWGTEGRKFRTNLIISTHKPSQKSLPGLVHLLNNRFIGLVDNALTSAHLTGQAGLECHKLTGKGDFTHVTGGLEADRFQVAMATRTDFERLARSEVRPLPVVNDTPAESRALNLSPPPEPDRGGRPPLGGIVPGEIRPDLAAYYWLHGPANISRRAARDILEISRTAHEAHRDFVEAMGRAYLQLRKSERSLLS